MKKATELGGDSQRKGRRGLDTHLTWIYFIFSF